LHREKARIDCGSGAETEERARERAQSKEEGGITCDERRIA
jgi:hypothetical protein